MVDNQPQKIKGYRDLSEDEIALMNEAKELAEKVGKFVDGLSAVHAQTGSHAIDLRWVNIGKTQLQQGFMAVIRGIAQPTTF